MNRVAGKCKPCGAGNNCSWSDEAKEGNRSVLPPDILPGFWAEPLNLTQLEGFSGHSVYKCRSPEACPGGPPGTCAGGRIGAACARCPDGHALVDGACEACENVSVWVPLVSALVLLPFGCFSFYKFCSKPPTMHGIVSRLV